MNPDEKQVLEKIARLSSDQDKRVEGHVDAPHGMTRPNLAAGDSSKVLKRGRVSELIFSEASIEKS